MPVRIQRVFYFASIKVPLFQQRCVIMNRHVRTIAIWAQFSNKISTAGETIERPGATYRWPTTLTAAPPTHLRQPFKSFLYKTTPFSLAAWFCLGRMRSLLIALHADTRLRFLFPHPAAGKVPASVLTLATHFVCVRDRA